MLCQNHCKALNVLKADNNIKSALFQSLKDFWGIEFLCGLLVNLSNERCSHSQWSHIFGAWKIQENIFSNCLS